MAFSLKLLLCFLAYVAIIFAGLFSGQYVWSEIISTITFLAIVLAAIVAVSGSPKDRAFFGSFVVAAAAYLMLTVIPGGHEDLVPTKRFLESLHVRLGPIHARRVAEAGFEPIQVDPWSIQIGPNRRWSANETFPTTRRIGHCVIATIFGLVAAQVGRWASARRRHSVEPSGKSTDRPPNSQE
jgi:hypothetical protein